MIVKDFVVGVVECECGGYGANVCKVRDVMHVEQAKTRPATRKMKLSNDLLFSVLVLSHVIGQQIHELHGSVCGAVCEVCGERVDGAGAYGARQVAQLGLHAQPQQEHGHLYRHARVAQQLQAVSVGAAHPLRDQWGCVCVCA